MIELIIVIVIWLLIFWEWKSLDREFKQQEDFFFIRLAKFHEEKISEILSNQPEKKFPDPLDTSK